MKKNDSFSEKIEERRLEDEVKDSYLDYAMSVIVSRALPDVRDGLKPVQRRILYTLWKLKLTSSAKFRKSAAIVGEVMGKFHPHGDAAIYESLVRMAQNFVLRYPLIEGQGNFGSLDDPPAQMRYTEARLSKIGEEMLTDLEKETVDFVSNYDGTLNEPVVLPAKIPNLLINGTTGIAVGVATNIPPHNLTEVCDALIYLIKNPKAKTSDLMKYILGPDFPTGGIIIDDGNLEELYNFGKGKITVRAKTEIVQSKKGTPQIIVSQIPYLVSKNVILEKIAQLVSEKKIEGIKDVYDLSDKEGIRIVIDLKGELRPEKVLNRLFAFTPLETSFYFNFLALSDGLLVKSFSLKEILESYLNHRKNVIFKRTSWELKKVNERIHILEGFNIALNNLNLVIKIIKEAKDKETAKVNLLKRLKLSEQQALAILELRLWQISRLEREKVIEELKKLKERKKVLESILSDPKEILSLIIKELEEIKEKFGDQRRTQIVKEKITEFKEEDLIIEEPTVIILTNEGYLKRISPSSFKVQERGGIGTLAIKTKENDTLSQLIFTSTVSDILFFTNKGKVFKLKAYKIPEKGKTTMGEPIVNFLSLSENEKVSALLSVEKEKEFFVLVTKEGWIKKIEKKNFENIRKSGLLTINLKKDDQVVSVKPISSTDEIILVSLKGQFIMFSEKEVKKLSREAKGIKGIKLSPSDEVVDLETVSKDRLNKTRIFTITENGFGKFSLLSSFRKQKRAGHGMKVHKINKKTGDLVKALLVDEKEPKKEILIASLKGQVLRIPLKSVPLLGRVSQGVRLIRFKEKDDKVKAVTLI